MNKIPRTVHSPRAYLKLDIPRHAYTESDAHVAQLVETLLKDNEGGDDEVSHADVLQALAITTAVRTAMAEAVEQGVARFSLKLLDVGVAPASKRALRVA